MIKIIPILLGLSLCFSNQYLYASTMEQSNIFHINIKKTASVTDEMVMIGDIADIFVPIFFKETIEKIKVGKSSKLGKIKVFARKRILSIIKSNRSLPEKITINSPQKVYVKRLSQKIRKKDLESFIENYLKNKFPKKKYRFQIIKMSGIDLYPMGRLTFNIRERKIQNKMIFYIRVLINGKSNDTIRVRADVFVYATLICASRNIKKGTILRVSDLQYLQKNILKKNDYITNTKKIIGYKLNKKALQGDTIYPNNLNAPLLIQKHNIVQVSIINDYVKIKAFGVAQKDGSKNQIIKVKILQSNQYVLGLVLQKAKVTFVKKLQ